MSAMIDIKNLPPYHECYIVARSVAGVFWYWGSWPDEKHAAEVAERVGGYVFHRPNMNRWPA